MKVSVVLPVSKGGGEWLPRILERLREVEGLEVICAGDDVALPAGSGARFVRVEAASRGARLQAGIDAASHPTILLHHPRSLVPAEGLRWLAERSGHAGWGGFTHAFDWDHPLLRFTSWYSNRVRAARGILYLDHCVFFDKALLTRPIPPVEIFEDTELSLILRESGPPALSPFLSTTSAVRFRANGPWRQALLNQRLKLEYLLGAPHRRLNARYERGLGLNS